MLFNWRHGAADVNQSAAANQSGGGAARFVDGEACIVHYSGLKAARSGAFRCAGAGRERGAIPLHRLLLLLLLLRQVLP